jgi:hypothetical protein
MTTITNTNILLHQGAINKATGEYVHPDQANKRDKYICPECNRDLVLCQGKIRKHHYRHKTDFVNPCHHYSNPSESQIHKYAKKQLKYFLEKKPITFIRKCCSCDHCDYYSVPEVNENCTVEIEHRLDYNGAKIADVALLGPDLMYLFEICYKHRTSIEDRPEPWFEIDAETLLEMGRRTYTTDLQIPCIRCEKCKECIKKEEEKIKQKLIKEKNEKIALLNKMIKECKDFNSKFDHDWPCNSYLNRLQSLRTQLKLTENDIEYTECNRNVYQIVHPISKQTVKLTSKYKLFVKSKWIQTTFYDVLKWYKKDYTNITNTNTNINTAINISNKSMKNDNDILARALNSPTKTERKLLLSQFLKENEFGTLNNSDKYNLTQMYSRFYTCPEGVTKVNSHEIQKISIERGEYNSKCFNLTIDNIKHIISIKRF